jgi:predicted transcriptional regulator
LKPEIARKLADLAEVTDRLPEKIPAPSPEEFFA